MWKVILLILAGFGVLVLASFYQQSIDFGADYSHINSFEECADAGYPVMESYPEQCKTPDGRNFVRQVEENVF